MGLPSQRVDPDKTDPESLTGFGYVPGRLVLCIPHGLAAATVQEPAAATGATA